MRFLAALLLLATLGGCSSVPAWIAAYWPDEAERARAEDIAACESRMTWDAVSPGGGNHGVFQINTVHRASFERVTGKAWSEAIYGPHNIQFARWLYDQQGWGPWSCAR